LSQLRASPIGAGVARVTELYEGQSEDVKVSAVVNATTNWTEESGG